MKRLTIKMDNSTNANAEKLITKCERALGDNVSEAVLKRLQKELEAIIAHGYVDEFLLAADLREYAARQNFELITRFPWQCSLVCYLLNISDIDPLFFNLPYERCFVSYNIPHRCFDFDIAEGTFDSFLSYLKTKYGEGNVGRAVYLKGGERHIKETAILVATNGADGIPHKTIDGEEVIALTVPEAVNRGFIVINLLETPSLTVLKNAFNLVKERYGREVKFDCHNLSDEATLKIFTNGDTDGVCYFETAICKDAVKGIRKLTFSDLADIISLTRPGFSETMPDYVKLANGTGLTNCTYQEDIINAALSCGVNVDDELLKKAIENHAYSKAHALERAFAAYKTAYFKAHYPKEYGVAINVSKSSKG